MAVDKRLAAWAWYARRWLVQRSFVVEWREQRYRDFVDLCGLDDHHRIVDVGSGGTGVSGTLGRFNASNPIVALDLVSRGESGRPNIRFVQGDATAMAFTDGEFDMAFCNSLIEHLPPAQQRLLANEIRRVASGYWIQTPNRYFPVEPHLLIPLYQFLPRRIRRFIDSHYAGGYTELLTRRDLESLFPEGDIYEERVGLLVKSIVTYRCPAPTTQAEGVAS
jgi:SAM-dependent methyltransferase